MCSVTHAQPVHAQPGSWSSTASSMMPPRIQLVMRSAFTIRVILSRPMPLIFFSKSSSGGTIRTGRPSSSLGIFLLLSLARLVAGLRGARRFLGIPTVGVRTLSRTPAAPAELAALFLREFRKPDLGHGRHRNLLKRSWQDPAQADQTRLRARISRMLEMY